jgi:hypothetical protein
MQPCTEGIFARKRSPVAATGAPLDIVCLVPLDCARRRQGRRLLELLLLLLLLLSSCQHLAVLGRAASWQE